MYFYLSKDKNETQRFEQPEIYEYMKTIFAKYMVKKL